MFANSEQDKDTSMDTVTVTIGRNVGDVPLPDEEWTDFVSRTRATVVEVLDEVFAIAPYTGSWDGVNEDAYVFYGALPDNGTPLSTLTERLRGSLASLATYYGQEAIGLSVGTSELVSSYITDDEIAELGR